VIDYDELIAEASLPEDTVPICLDGRLMHRWEEVKARVDARADTPADDRLGAGQVDPEQAELDALTAQVEGKNRPWLLRGMPDDEFAEFAAKPEFKARTLPDGSTDPRDARMGLNRDVFVPALVKACLVEPDVSVDGRWDVLRKKLTRGQMARLFAVAWELNSEDRDLPFSPSGSPTTRSSATG
jgi:hypothetical protein